MLSLAPKYDELAALYTNNPTWNTQVTIAKVDATANDVPDEIQGFPTIKLFKAGAKDTPIDYSGSRTIEDLATFVKENGKYAVDAYVSPAEDAEMPDADEMGKQAPAASEKAEKAKEAVQDKAGDAAESAKSAASDATASVKSGASDAAEAVKTAVTEQDHDEL